MRRRLGYRDAVVLLGGDLPGLAALDRVLAAGLSLATGGLSATVLSAFTADGRIIRAGHDLVATLHDRLTGTTGADRAQRLEAAHTIIVVAAFFEALDGPGLPWKRRDVRVRQNPAGQGAVRPNPGERGLAEMLATVAPPRPSAFLPYEDCLDALESWYGELAARMSAVIHGLPLWEGLDAAARAEADHFLGTSLSADAVARYQELYSRLAVEVADFGFWSGQVDQQATRWQVRRCLAGIEPLLSSLSSGREPADVVLALSNAYRSVLGRPILADGLTPAGVRMPTLEEGYLDPDFRVSAVQAGELTCDEDWWATIPVRGDLTEYLAAALTSPEASTAPLVVLGQPGAGKSVLTKVLAARLPPGDFLPVRVVLREVPADADIQDQVEHAIRAATGLRADWPDVARAAAAGGAVPVVLLDGFDELLQATGVSQSDYLLRLARFQQREADQGRPVIVVVTSRIAVADRVRYPSGTVALRLEPFRDEHIESWLEIWNACNERPITARGLKPLGAQTVTRHRALACEPLLLLMLAMYDADANALQRGTGEAGGGIDEASLYEQLLTAFATREVEKSHDGMAPSELRVVVEHELQRLSLIAFSILNRSRQWVTEAELDSDLAALLSQPAAQPAGVRLPLTPAELAIGRFFFIQRAQALVAGSRRQTFEFLHATFGEYLAARLTVQLATDLLRRRSPLMVATTAADDDLLYALLSFAPLSSRQVLRFVTSLCDQQVPPADRAALAGLLIDVFAASETRSDHRYSGYRPARLATSSRHGIYSANLVLLILALEPAVSAARLFGTSAPDRDPPGMWHRRVLLWRSSMSEPDWTDLALALSIRHTWHGDAHDLQIRLSRAAPAVPEPIDPYWHFGYPPSNPDRDVAEWHRPYWNAIFHKMDVSGGTNDSAVMHAIEPMFRRIGASITTFHGSPGGPASSIAHDLVELWLSRLSKAGGSGLDSDDLIAAYERLSILFGSSPLWDAKMQAGAVTLVLDFLQRDAARLPPGLVIRYLNAALALVPRDGPGLRLIADAALAALPAGPAGSGDRDALTQIAAAAVSVKAVSVKGDGGRSRSV